MEKFVCWEDANGKAKNEELMYLNVEIYKNLQGKYEVNLLVREAYDGFTTKIFEGNGLRNVVEKNGDFYYADSKDKDSVLKMEFESFEEAKKFVEETLEKIEQDRAKVRRKVREEYYIVI
jgi:hypothetical protein